MCEQFGAWLVLWFVSRTNYVDTTYLFEEVKVVLYNVHFTNLAAFFGGNNVLKYL